MPKSQIKLVDLSILTIIKFFLVILALFFIYLTLDVIAILFVSLILAAAIGPAVTILARWRVPRSVSVIIFIVVLMAFFLIILTFLIPLIGNQLTQLLSNLPRYYEKFNIFITTIKKYFFFVEDSNFSQIIESLNLKQYFTDQAGPVLARIYKFFSGLISFIVVLVITFYLVVEQDALNRVSRLVVPIKYQEFFVGLLRKIQVQIVNWLKGQLILSFIVGLMVYVSLTILGVDYALVLALIAFLGEFIPYLGPVLAAIPAILIAFVEAPILGLFVLIIFVVLQQAENHILVPKVMQRAVGLNPVISIVALLIGAKFGLIGVILAIPVTTAIVVVLKEFYLMTGDEPVNVK